MLNKNLRLLAKLYFDKVKNDIDIDVEESIFELINCGEQHNNLEEKISNLHSSREIIFKEVERILQANLSNIEENQINFEGYDDPIDLSDVKRLDEIGENLFVESCFFISKRNLINLDDEVFQKLGVLIINKFHIKSAQKDSLV